MIQIALSFFLPSVVPERMFMSWRLSDVTRRCSMSDQSGGPWGAEIVVEYDILESVLLLRDLSAATCPNGLPGVIPANPVGTERP